MSVKPEGRNSVKTGDENFEDGLAPVDNVKDAPKKNTQGPPNENTQDPPKENTQDLAAQDSPTGNEVVDPENSVLLYTEKIPSSSKRELSKMFARSFRPVQNFMARIGGFPIKSYPKKDDNSIVFQYKRGSYSSICFFISLGLLAILCTLSTLNMASIMLHIPKQPKTHTCVWPVKVEMGTSGPANRPLARINWKPIFVFRGHTFLDYPSRVAAVQKRNRRGTKTGEIKYKTFKKTRKELHAEEMFIFRRNAIPILIVVAMMYHIVIAGSFMYHRRELVAKYMRYFAESVEIMKFDAADKARRYSQMFLFYYISWFILFCFVNALHIAPVSSGAPVALAITWLRAFYPQIHTISDLGISFLRGFGAVIYLYVAFCSKVYALFFIYICKILKNTCDSWNHRLERVFTEVEHRKSREEKCTTRTGFDHMFKDYINILDLIDGANQIFSYVIESYFVVSILSMVLQVYYLFRPIWGGQKEFAGARIYDMVVVGIYLAGTWFIFYLVMTGAAQVGETFAYGLEVIRRQGILGPRSDPEKHFMISLYMSYTGHFDTALTEGGFIHMNKPSLVRVVGWIVCCIIIIFAVEPSLGITKRSHRDAIGIDIDDQYKFRTLLTHVEETLWYDERKEPV